MARICFSAAHVYRGYLADREKYGKLYCQVQNCTVRDLSEHLIACGNLGLPLDDAREADIAAYITETRVQDCKLKKPSWKNVGEFSKYVTDDAFADYVKYFEREGDEKLEPLTADERKRLGLKVVNLCKALYDIKADFK